MTTTTLTQPRTPPTQLALIIWHVVLAVGGLGGVVYFWLAAETPVWQRVILMLALALGALFSAYAVPLLAGQRHRGRTIGLFLNYLAFIVCLLFLLHTLGAFSGIDGLANVFGRGVPALFIIFGGYLIGALGDRFEGTAAEKQFRNAGRLVALAGAIVFLIRVEAWNGLLVAGRRYDTLLPFALTLGLVLFGAAVMLLWRPASADYFNATNADQEILNGWLFVSPNLIGFLIFFAGPLIFSLYVSFTNWDAFGTQDWIGWENYARIFSLSFTPLDDIGQRAAEVLDINVYDEVTRFQIFGRAFVIGAVDKLFWIALGNTLRFAVLAIPLATIPALLLANLLNSKVPGMTFFRAVYFLPSVAAVVGIALVWQLLFNATVGYINYGISTVIDFLNQFGGSITDPQIRWLSSQDTALLSVVIMTA